MAVERAAREQEPVGDKTHIRNFSEPRDQPYQERTASFSDSFGNIWYIAAYKG